jgi:hypothetical protein
MRIAQVAPLYESVSPRGYGGTERIVSYLTEALVREGHKVTLFASGDSVTTAHLMAPCQRSFSSKGIHRRSSSDAYAAAPGGGEDGIPRPGGVCFVRRGNSHDPSCALRLLHLCALTRSRGDFSRKGESSWSWSSIGMLYLRGKTVHLDGATLRLPGLGQYFGLSDAEASE